jgi:hypothetical protein
MAEVIRRYTSGNTKVCIEYTVCIQVKTGLEAGVEIQIIDCQ